MAHPPLGTVVVLAGGRAVFAATTSRVSPRPPAVAGRAPFFVFPGKGATRGQWPSISAAVSRLWCAALRAATWYMQGHLPAPAASFEELAATLTSGPGPVHRIGAELFFPRS